MPPFYADLHIHSKFSRACSRDCDLEHLALVGRRKGISVIDTSVMPSRYWTVPCYSEVHLPGEVSDS
jgi:PHP family Zn ribbon phosphoesterase